MHVQDNQNQSLTKARARARVTDLYETRPDSDGSAWRPRRRYRQPNTPCTQVLHVVVVESNASVLALLLRRELDLNREYSSKCASVACVCVCVVGEAGRTTCTCITCTPSSCAAQCSAVHPRVC